MHNQVGGVKADTVVKLVLIFFISLLSFSVGTFVGKQVSDSDYRRAALEEDYKKPVEATTAESSDKQITDEDVAQLTDEFVKAEKEKIADPGRSLASSETAKPEAHESTSSGKDGYRKLTPHKGAEEKVSIAAQKVANDHSPTDVQPKPRKPDSVLPSVATSAIGKYTIQVASYATEAEAKNHAAELKGKGWNAFYVPAQIKTHTWYRVSVGLFPDAKRAQTFRADFMKEANVSTAIVQKIVQ